jgi:hypothetical protein
MRQISILATILVLAIVLQSASDLRAQENETKEDSKKEAAIPTIAEKVEGMQSFDGYFPFYWDAKTGAILMEISQWDREFLYVHSLATGLGSNPVGLDRGQLGDEKVVHFRRIGPKVLLIHRNLRFRAITDNKLERRAVQQSFAMSVLWGGEVVAETDQTVLVDATDLLVSDMHGVVETLKRNKQGDYSLDDKRSAVYLANCKGFPENTELESTLTFSGSKPGNYVQQTTPTPNAITLRQHHSFIKLPDDNYKPRKYDVRSPSIFITFADYASPLNAELQQRWITRHRLIKKNPDAELSEAEEPIVYYVDAGAPKQIQQALVEGASWWNEAFEAAGFKDAFEVKLLPPDADPLDVRYNVIQWVHRSTRGWSYGGSVIDPRTGEIIKGHVTLGSLRVRQDQLLVQGLQSGPTSAADRSRCACCGIGGIVEDTTLAAMDAESKPLDVALARIRQLSAHEVGHTLGFVHNFAASTYGDRESVMDYPAPRVKITDEGELDLSDAYGVGIGEWDKVSVQFAYSQFDEDESEQLNKILEGAKKQGMLFISDADARPAGAAHPMGNLWDNGSDPIEQLKHVMKVRRIALDRFDPKTLPAGTTQADVAQYFTPLFLHHRYQLNAAGKVLGGSNYHYGYVDHDNEPHSMVDSAKQKAAMAELIAAIKPAQLAISPEVLAAINPRPYSTIRDQEILPTQTGRVFDPLAAARVATDLTLNELFQHQRLARLTVQSRFDKELEVNAVVSSMVNTIWANSLPSQFEGRPELVQIGRVVREALVEQLVQLVDNPDASLDVRSAATACLTDVATQKNRSAKSSSSESAFCNMLSRRAKQVLERPFSTSPASKTLRQPPGSPIGSGGK